MLGFIGSYTLTMVHLNTKYHTSHVEYYKYVKTIERRKHIYILNQFVFMIN